MKRKILYYTVALFIIILTQSTVLDYIKVYDVKPNLMLVFIVCIAFLNGSTEGAIVGLSMGLMQDMLFGRVLGLYALLGMYLGLVVGSVNKRLYRDNILIVVFFTFVSTIIYEIMVFVLSWFGYIIRGQVNLLRPLGEIILPEAIYNSFASIFIYIIIIKIHFKFEEMSRATRKY